MSSRIATLNSIKAIISFNSSNFSKLSFNCSEVLALSEQSKNLTKSPISLLPSFFKKSLSVRGAIFSSGNS